jgi:hypothetical protein
MTLRNKPPSLEEVLAYCHPGVVNRFRKEHRSSREEAEEVFREMLKWLYLCAQGIDGPEGFACHMSPEIEKIDWMWHAFVLFTRDYADFCDRYFGFFLHHVPEEDSEEASLDEGPLRGQLERQYGLVYDLLGADTLTAWYDQCRYAAPN